MCYLHVDRARGPCPKLESTPPFSRDVFQKHCNAHRFAHFFVFDVPEIALLFYFFAPPLVSIFKNIIVAQLHQLHQDIIQEFYLKPINFWHDWYTISCLLNNGNSEISQAQHNQQQRKSRQKQQAAAMLEVKSVKRRKFTVGWGGGRGGSDGSNMSESKLNRTVNRNERAGVGEPLTQQHQHPKLTNTGASGPLWKSDYTSWTSINLVQSKES